MLEFLFVVYEHYNESVGFPEMDGKIPKAIHQFW